MVNIQSPTAEIRRGKERKKKKKKKQHENIYGLPYCIGRATIKKKEERRRRKKQDENIMVCPIT